MAMYDAIIIGLGGMGSAAAFELSESGYKVLGLEQFGELHGNGSSFGKTRMIRKAYMEGAFYIPLLERAYQKWHQLDQLERRPLIKLCGGIYIAEKDDKVVKNALGSAKKFNIPVDLLTATEIRARFPSFEPDPDQVGVFEPSAGYVNPEATLTLYHSKARENGAELKFEEGVKDFSVKADRVVVETKTGEYQAKKLVITAGAWLGRMMAFLGKPLPLDIWRMVLHWFEPKGEAGNYLPGRFVPNLWRLPDGHLVYGFPWTEEEAGLKYAFHDRYQVVKDLSELKREVKRKEVSQIRKALKKPLPSVPYRHHQSKVCLYTMTPDAHFVLGPVQGEEKVILAGGFSGHGFKFVPVIGEILRDFVAEKKSKFDLEPFRPDRF